MKIFIADVRIKFGAKDKWNASDILYQGLENDGYIFEIKEIKEQKKDVKRKRV